MSMQKQIKQLLEWAGKRGWESSLTKSGHYRLQKPGCGLIFTSSSPKKPSALDNCRARIKRAEREMEGEPA